MDKVYFYSQNNNNNMHSQTTLKLNISDPKSKVSKGCPPSHKICAEEREEWTTGRANIIEHACIHPFLFSSESKTKLKFHNQILYRAFPTAKGQHQRVIRNLIPTYQIHSEVSQSECCIYFRSIYFRRLEINQRLFVTPLELYCMLNSYFTIEPRG